MKNTEQLSQFNCPKCKASFYKNTETVEDICQHIQKCYCELKCSECDVKRYETESDLIDHYVGTHHKNTNGSLVSEISCPLCNKSGLSDCNSLLSHLRHIHAGGTHAQDERKKRVDIKRKLPKVGDRVIARWSESKWQYFSATVSSYNEDTMQYKVDWDHGVTVGLMVDVADIALDQVPEDFELGEGTLVLFRQGTYDALGTKRWRGGRRWHQGVITGVNIGSSGYKTYSGHHTKSEVDGKFVNYRSFSFNYHNLTKYDFRLAPNVFDVLHFEEKSKTTPDADIYLSYDLVDSYQAVKNNEVKADKIPSSYRKIGYEKMCDPADIETFLQNQGLKVSKHKRTGKKEDIKEVSSMIKRATVFIAFLSDRYVHNNQCQMEFQYAKTSLKKPVIPLVVGDGSFKWVASSIGMLIAGELFLDFHNKEIEEEKSAELLANIRNHIPLEKKEEDEGMGEDAKVDEDPPEVFLSYCWANSQLALDAKQIQNVNGSKLSDPRFLKEKISEYGYDVWLDVEQLQSANADAGLFGQIVEGVKSAQLVIPCVSDEYAKSQNCRMEFQFAFKSLSKPVVPVVVGYGEDWKGSVVGALLSTHDRDPINLQGIDEESKLEEMVSQVVCEIEIIIGRPRNTKSFNEKRKRRLRSGDEDDNDDDKNDNDDAFSKESSDESRNEAIENKTTPRLLRNFSLSPPRLRAPKIKDRVIGHYRNSSYYMATIVGSDKRSMTYTVEWEDGDLCACVQPFDRVALDKAPERDDVGIGSVILFPQGTYVCEPCSTEHPRYNEGVLTSIDDADRGKFTVSGRHTKPGTGWIFNSSTYSYNFESIPLKDIRLAPTAFDFLEMCVNEKNEKESVKVLRRCVTTSL